MTTSKYYWSLKSIVFSILFFNFVSACAQDQDTTRVTALPSVIIKAFEQNRRLKDIPAAVSYVGKQTLEMFSPSSIVSAVNSTPGVRMEERSPGSYRLNIRGSSLRSPFGVRNVKIYYNEIPITDPGGHTYLNQLGYYNFNSLEIIRGSNNSLYGAGTGGVMLIESLNSNAKPGVFAEYATGSYNLQNVYASVTTGSGNIISRTGFQHQANDGYRDHSRLKRDVLSWDLLHVGKTNILKTSFLYGDLFYQTPGALTKSEFETDPKAARPGNQFFPGAEDAHASVHQKMFLLGASWSQDITTHLQNKTVLYGMFTQLINPTINNYGKSSEPHTGGRTIFKYSHPFKNGILNIDLGAELQQGFTSVSIYKNAGGNADSLRSSDEINNRQQFIFLQVSFDIGKWTIITGSSLNKLHVNFERFMVASLGKQNRNFKNQFAPRFALMRKFKNINIYGNISRGFSPPTTAELLPTGGAINFGLNPESTINFELGLKAILFKGLYVDINSFSFSLTNAIVQRRNAGGGDFFINAGKTKQQGIESYLNYAFFRSTPSVENASVWVSHTWNDFHYKEFKQLSNDFSGKRIPSVARHTVSSGFDLLMKSGWLGTISYYFSGKIPLNDANNEYASAYHLLSGKAGYQLWLKNKCRLKIFAGVENLLNSNYSLGNDINGFGGRYYNAAPARNYYAAIVLQFNTKPEPANPTITK
jgi:iron complex outermembrane receptor protein